MALSASRKVRSHAYRRAVGIGASRSYRPAIEALEDRLALSTFTVVNTNNAGAGSLRQAIIDANANTGADLINFNIGGGGIQSIAPTSGLPTIIDPVTIDGTTQPGYVDSPIIELNGESAGSASGLVITAGNSTVRGLVINRFQFTSNFLFDGRGNGIVLSTAGGNVIEGNYIGTDVSGTIGLGNRRLGVLIFAGSSGNRIGTNGDGVNDDAERNVVSSNGTVGNSSSGAGVAIAGAGTNNNVVAGNYIGTDAGGSFALGNTRGGVGVQAGAKGNRIGTDGNGIADAAERNVISGNTLTGVSIAQVGTENNTVAGNYIGTDASGAAALRNGRSGIAIFEGARGNQVGGATAPLANIIAYHPEAGVALTSLSTDTTKATGNRIQGNSIHSNGGLGIDLNLRPTPLGTPPDGVTPNDLDDADVGPNNLQNFPVINVAHSGPKTFVSGTLNSLPDTVFTLDFYAGPAEDADPSGHGEGARYLGSAVVGGASDGNVVYEVLLDGATTAEEVVTATATDPDGNTSEFSVAVPVTTLILTGTFGDDTFEFGRHDTGGIAVTQNSLPIGVASEVFVSDPLGSETYIVNFFGWEGFVSINDEGSFIDDTLIVNGTLGDDVIAKVANQVTYGSPVTETVFYGGIENVVVDGGFGNDTITDPGTDTTILGGAGDDTIIIDATFGNGVVVDGGDGSDTYLVLFGNLAGPVTVADSGTSGTDSLTIQGTPAADAFVLAGNQVQHGSELIILAAPIANLRLEGGDGDDSTTIAGFTAPISSLTVDGSGGTNTVTIEGDPPAGVTLNLVAAVQTVQIDVRRGSLNLASQGVIAVAMFTSTGFDAAQVDVGSVVFAGAHASASAFEDVDGDGDLDLVLHFRTQDTNLRELYAALLAHDINGDGVLDSNHQVARVSLSGQTFDERAFEGFDSLDLFLSGKALRQMLEELAAEELI